MFAALQRLVGFCRHPEMYREHREVDGHLVVHFVCGDCGYARPVIARTPEELARLAPARPGRV